MNALILGATSDMAQAVSALLAENGYSLTLAGRSLDKLRPIASDLRLKYEIEVNIVIFDALAFSSHKEFYDKLSVKPDLCICAFGVLGDQEIDQKNWNNCEETIHANYTGAVSVLNIIANEYESAKSGCIVGISSVAGERGRKSNYIYGSAKAGFTSYLSGLRNRLAASGVHVVTVKPGFVLTKMTEHLDLPPRLTAKPEQVAKSILKAVRKKKNVIYVLGLWKWIMLIIRNIPEGIFKKLNL